MVICCIGYQTPPIQGVPFDKAGGRFANIAGRIEPGLYCVGWARRGPSGTIGTNKPDGFVAAEQIAEDVSGSSGKPGRAGLDALLATRNVDIVTFRDWKRIEQIEQQRARNGAPREKITSIAEMIAALS
jgi:ferredoxin--NADP+ reductase